MSQNASGSVFTTVISTLRLGTVMPSGTALIAMGSLPPCFFRMCSHPFRLKCAISPCPMCPLMIFSAWSILAAVTTCPVR